MVKCSVSAAEVFREIESVMLRDGFDIVIDMEKSQGSRIVNAINGESWLDFYTFFASAPFGMNHPKLANDEFKERIFRAAINKVANSVYTPRRWGSSLRPLGRSRCPGGSTTSSS